MQGTQQGHCGRIFASRTKGRVMLEGDQWNEVVHPPALPYVVGGNQIEASVFQMGILRLPTAAKVAKFPHRLFFKDKDPISGVQGIGKGDTKDKGLVVASKPLYFCIGRAGPAVLSGPLLQVYTTEGSGPEARPRLGGGNVSLILPPSAIIAAPH